MKRILSGIVLCMGMWIADAQYFAPELDNSSINMSKEVYAVTNAGDTIRGKMGAAMIGNGQLRSFTIKQEDGTKSKFKSPDVKLLAIKPSKLQNLESAMSVPNVMKASEIDFDAVMNREWVFFEQALLPKKKDKYVMMQLLNPGFDSKIKVYLDPNANESMGVGIGGIQVAGGEDKSYLVVYDGNKSEVYKKKRYKKEALTLLYKDCEVFKENYKGEKFDWSDFAEHVLVYDQMCK
ncbi:MAG: hypothetical protein ABJN36_10460 [Cyclobacteriaceae bacterium]